MIFTGGLFCNRSSIGLPVRSHCPLAARPLAPLAYYTPVSRCGRARCLAAGPPGSRRQPAPLAALPRPLAYYTSVSRCGRARCPHRAANPRTARAPWSSPSPPVPHALALLGRRDGRPWRLATRALPPLPPRNSPAPTPVPHHPSCHLTGFGGHPRSMSPHSPAPRRRTPPPRPWGLPTASPLAARLFKHASYGRLPTYVRAPNPSTQKQPESTVHEQSRLCSCRSVRFVARCHAHRFDDASHSQYGLR